MRHESLRSFVQYTVDVINETRWNSWTKLTTGCSTEPESDWLLLAWFTYGTNGSHHARGETGNGHAAPNTVSIRLPPTPPTGLQWCLYNIIKGSVGEGVRFDAEQAKLYLFIYSCRKWKHKHFNKRCWTIKPHFICLHIKFHWTDLWIGCYNYHSRSAFLGSRSVGESPACELLV